VFKNVYDSEVQRVNRKTLRTKHLRLKREDIVINTCGFIDNAKAESANMILNMPIRKKEDWYVFVTGCLSERYRPDLENTNVDQFLTQQNYHNH
jgi:ribosomal protein S12 methylthiotransferase